MSKSPRVLVTGAAGLIGSNLIQQLNQMGVDKIIATDRLVDRDERWRHMVPLRFLDYVDGQDFIEKTSKNEKYFGNFWAVFHLGACSSTVETDVDFLMRNNFETTKSLALWSLRRGSRFIYASSAATYGDGSLGMLDDDAKLDSLRPLNAYAYSKHLFDLYASRNGILGRITGLKYFNVFGPNEDHKGDMRSVVAKAYQQIQQTGEVSLFRSYKPGIDDGESQRDFLYVKDAVRMTAHFAFASHQPCGIYNLGSGVATSWNSLVSFIFQALHLPTKIKYIDMPEILRAKYQYFTQANISKLRQSGYNADITPCGQAVTDYIQNYLQPQIQ